MIYLLQNNKIFFLISIFSIFTTLTYAKISTFNVDIENNKISLFPDKAFEKNCWRVNRWRGKTKVKGQLSYPTEKTPTSKACIKIKLSTSGKSCYGCYIISPSISPNGNWRSRNYSSITCWIKGNYNGKKIKIVADCASGKYSWQIALDTEKWKKITLDLNSAYTKKGNRKDLNSLKRLLLASYHPVEFSIGGFSLKEKATSLAVNSINALTIPLKENINIKLDGNLNENVWKNALKIENLNLTGSGKPAKEKTSLMLFADSKNLYIGAKLFTQDTKKLKAFKKKRDAAVYFDDCFELLIDDNLDAKTYRHLSLNSIGTVADYFYRFDQTLDNYMLDKAWNPEWKHKSRLTPNAWIVEIVIPLKTLGLQIKKPFCIQIGRENKVGKENSCLGLTRRFTERENFSVAVIGNKFQKPPKFGLSMKEVGNMFLTGTTIPEKSLKIDLKIADIYGKKQQIELDFKSDKTGLFSVPFKINSPVEGTYRLVITGKSNGKRFSTTALNTFMSIPSCIKFGDIRLNPLPKKIVLEKNKFTFTKNTPIIISNSASLRTRETARYLRNEVHLNLMGWLPPLSSCNDRIKKCFSLSLRQNAKINNSELRKKINALPAEGYYLSVSPDKITIIGADEPGLYYGVVSLIQFFRANLIKKHAPEMTCVEIFDWPDTAWRMVTHYPPAHKWRKELGHNIPEMKKFIKNVLAGSKINHYALQLKYEFEFDEYANLTDARCVMKMDELKEIADTCKKHFIEFIPMMNSGMRATNFLSKYPELMEKGYPRQVNVLNKKWYKILFSCYTDVLRALPKTKYFHIRHDEWWHSSKGKVTTELQGISKWKIYADNIIKIHDFFKKRNIKTIMFCDKLLKSHGGGYPQNVWKALKLLPKDIIMANWSTRYHLGSTKMLHDKGFSVIDTFNSFGVIESTDIPIILGYSTLFYAHYMQTFWFHIDKMRTAYTHGVLRGADYSWNLKRDSQMPLGEWRRKYLKNIIPLYFFPKRKKSKWKQKRCIALEKYANYSTKKWFGIPKQAPVFKRGKNEVGFIPFTLLPQSENDIIVATKENDEVAIDMGNKAIGSLFFLQGVFLPNKKRNAFKKRGRRFSKGIPLGEIQIEYEDAQTKIIPLLMGYNTNSITPNLPASRFMYGVQYTHDIKTINGKLACLYLQEWVNPYPGRLVKKIIWKSYGLEAVPVLFGLTFTR